MASNFAKRLDKLERLIKERLTLPPVVFFQPDPEIETEVFLDGFGLPEVDRDRAFVVRWQTEAEADELVRNDAEGAWWARPKVSQPTPPLALPAPEKVSRDAKSTPNLPVRYVETDEHHARWAEHLERIARQRFGRKPDPTFI
jgi:hypothetical protein